MEKSVLIYEANPEVNIDSWFTIENCPGTRPDYHWPSLIISVFKIVLRVLVFIEMSVTSSPHRAKITVENEPIRSTESRTSLMQNLNLQFVI